MENLNEKAVYKLNASCGRQGDLTGLFIAKKNHVKLLFENNFKVYFGEVLGKHSKIFGEIEEKEIVFVSDSQDVIDVIETHQLENGFNPFDYTAINTEREDFQDLTILEIVEILEKELVERILIIGVARGEGVNNSSHDDKKDKIKGSIDNLTNRQIEITKQTAIDFLEWTEKGMWSKFESRTDGLHLIFGWYNTHNYAAMKQPLTTEQLFEQFEKQYTEPCLENKPKSDGEDVDVVSA